MTFRTPLKQVSYLGSAGNGTKHWWHQRVTAVALVILGLWFVIAMALLPDHGAVTVTAWIQQPVTTVMLSLVVAVACYHSFLGVQVVLEDYLHVVGVKTIAVVLSGFVHAGVAAIGLYSIAKIAFGSVI